MELSNVKFVMIYIIHKILVLFKNCLDYFKDNIFECFFKEYNTLFKKKKNFFFQDMMIEIKHYELNNILIKLGHI